MGPAESVGASCIPASRSVEAPESRNGTRLLRQSGPPRDKAVLQGQIDATDRQIDRLVYELYGLTEEEIRIVEQAGG